MRYTGPLQSKIATRNNANIRNNCIQKQIAFDFFKRRGGVNVKSIFGITVVRYKEAFGTSKSQVSRNMHQISEQTMFFCIGVSACVFCFLRVLRFSPSLNAIHKRSNVFPHMSPTIKLHAAHSTSYWISLAPIRKLPTARLHELPTKGDYSSGASHRNKNNTN